MMFNILFFALFAVLMLFAIFIAEHIVIVGTVFVVAYLVFLFCDELHKSLRLGAKRVVQVVAGFALVALYLWWTWPNWTTDYAPWVRCC